MIPKIGYLIHRKWLQHLLFWTLSLYAITDFFSISNTVKAIDVLYSISFHLCLLPVVYINLKWLVPKFLRIDRFVLFPVLLGMDLLLGLALHDLVFDVLIPHIFEGYYIVSFADKSLLVIIFTVYLGITTLLKLSRSWFLLQELEKSKVNLELSALKTQLNPHFLFNGLNSIYSLSLNRDSKASEAILKLSDMLKYVLYEVGNTFTQLEKEIEMIRQYLHLQSLRFPENPDLTFTLTGDPTGKKIAPMLFFPLVENAFKHGNPGHSIQITLTIGKNDVSCRCVNSISRQEKAEGEKAGGVGLKNIRARLELLYPGKHTFGFAEKEGEFWVEMNIQLQ